MKALAFTAILVLALIGGGVGWLYMNPAPGTGEPRAVVTIDPGDASGAAPDAGAAEQPPDDGAFTMPPGVAIIGLDPNAGAAQPPAQPEARAPEVPAAPGPSLAPEAPAAEASPAEAPGLDWQTDEPSLPGLDLQSAPDAGPALPPVQEAGMAGGVVRLAAAPVDALTETSPFGKIPKVGADGKRAADIYARPAAEALAPAPVKIALLVVGLGLSEAATQDAIDKLPGTISLAFGAYGRNVSDWAARARSAGHEILLQIPLEPYDYPDNDPGPHTLLTSLSADENRQRLHWLMARFTGYVGLTNHMGAKFASAQNSFLPVLEEARDRGLIYLDDGTASRSAAGQIATDSGVGFRSAHVQIDGVPDAVEIRKQLARLEARAREHGIAIGVASSLPITIAEIRNWANGLAARDIVLVPVTAAARSREQT